MACWSIDQKVCASCRYWLGRRDIDFMGHFFEAIDSEGKCMGPDNSFRLMIIGEGSSCVAWESFREN